MIKKKSKVHHQSLNLFGCVILVYKLTKRLFKYLNLFGYIILVRKHENLSHGSSNLFSFVILIPKLIFKYHLGQKRANLKLYMEKCLITISYELK